MSRNKLFLEIEMQQRRGTAHTKKGKFSQIEEIYQRKFKH